MKRLNIVRNLLVIGSLAFATASLGGCALESSSGGTANGAEPGADDLVEGAKDDPTTVHAGSAGNLGVYDRGGIALPSALPITEGEDDGSGNNGPQPQPWTPPLSLRSAESSGDGHNK